MKNEMKEGIKNFKEGIKVVKQADLEVNPSGNLANLGDIKTTGRNVLCPCNSGKKFKKCHGLEQ